MEVLEAATVEGCLQVLREQEVNTVILDLQMPTRAGSPAELTGLGLINQIKFEFSSPRIVIYSGFLELVGACLTANADGFVYKGDRLYELERCLTESPTATMFLSTTVSLEASKQPIVSALRARLNYQSAHLTTPGPSLPADVRALLAALNSRIWQEELSIGGTQRELGVTNKAVGARFRLWVGWHPKAYVLFHRTTLAGVLLAREMLSKAEISVLCGFRDSSALLKAMGRRLKK